jgi:hypothetical protein
VVVQVEQEEQEEMVAEPGIGRTMSHNPKVLGGGRIYNETMILWYP